MAIGGDPARLLQAEQYGAAVRAACAAASLLDSLGVTYAIHGKVAAIYYGADGAAPGDVNVMVGAGGITAVSDARGCACDVREGYRDNGRMLRLSLGEGAYGIPVDMTESYYKKDKKHPLVPFFSSAEEPEIALVPGEGSLAIYGVNDLLTAYICASVAPRRVSNGKALADEEIVAVLAGLNSGLVRPGRIRASLEAMGRTMDEFVGKKYGYVLFS